MENQFSIMTEVESKNTDISTLLEIMEQVIIYSEEQNLSPPLSKLMLLIDLCKGETVKQDILINNLHDAYFAENKNIEER